jgi:hypothetical protein
MIRPKNEPERVDQKYLLMSHFGHDTSFPPRRIGNWAAYFRDKALRKSHTSAFTNPFKSKA